MSDVAEVDLDLIVRSLEAIAERLRATQREQSVHSIGLKEAAHIASISEAQMRKRCEENIYGIHPGGYGHKREGTNRWMVVFAPFIATVPVNALQRVSRS